MKCFNQEEISLEKYKDFLELCVKQCVINQVQFPNTR